MDFVRTPDERFAGLEDYSFSPNYLFVDDTEGGKLRVHYLDEGPSDGKTVLLMHGQPAWSYLYRKMIPLLVAEGFRVIAPDLIGLGRSDKPTRQEDYTYARHVAWMSDWLMQMNLTSINVFFQDWGSMIGLRLVAAFPERFDRVVLSNGGLVAGPVPKMMASPLREAYKSLPVIKSEELDARFRDQSGIPGFLYWVKFAAESPEMLTPGVVMDAIGGARQLTPAEKAGFDAPFPDESYIAGMRRFPALAPLFHDQPEVRENAEAWKVLEKFENPFLLAFADDDPVNAPMEAPFRKKVPGCKGMPHRTIQPAGHFPQQDQPEQCVKAILDIMEH